MKHKKAKIVNNDNIDNNITQRKIRLVQTISDVDVRLAPARGVLNSYFSKKKQELKRAQVINTCALKLQTKVDKIKEQELGGLVR